MRWIVVVTALIALTLAVFALWPGLDLSLAHVFYDRGGFAGHDGLARFGRDFFRVAPFVVLAAYIALYALRRAGVAVFWKTSSTPMMKMTTPPMALTPWWVLTSRNMKAAPMNMSRIAESGAPK